METTNPTEIERSQIYTNTNCETNDRALDFISDIRKKPEWSNGS